MTPTPHGQVPEALRLAHIFDNPLPPEWPDMVAAAAELRRQHTRIAELEAQIEALSGVQALSAAHAGFVPVAAFDRLHAHAESLAAPEVGNSGFDYKTAADFLNGKTVSDEAVRKFVAASRWAHDERAALSATLLAMHGVLTSREAEIALLKKALLEAEAAPQQEAQEPALFVSAKQLAALTDHDDPEGEHGRYLPARKTSKGLFTQPLYTTPQPSPAPLSESIDQVERALAIIGVVGAIIGVVGAIDGHDVVRRESVLEIARRAAIAAQGGKA